MSRSRNEAPDPVFLAELKGLVRQGKPPVAPPEKVVIKKKVKVYDKQALYASLIMHACVGIYFLLRAFFPNLFLTNDEIQARLRMQQTQGAIRVDVVGLPSLTRQQLEKIDLTEEAAQSKSKTKAPPEEKAPEISKTAMKIPDSMLTKQEQEASRAERLKAAKAALKKELSAESRREALMKKLNNSEGHKPVEGNIVSQGYSAAGSVATASEAYKGKLLGHLHKFYNAPGWMNASNMKATVLVKLSADGHIFHKEFLKRSGNQEFDQIVDDAISQADPYPAPPEALRQTFLEDGIEWRFP